MNLAKLKKKLKAIVALDGTQPSDILASYIVGEFLGDYNSEYRGIEEGSPILQRIGDLASDLEISNGNEKELQEMWAELKELITHL